MVEVTHWFSNLTYISLNKLMYVKLLFQFDVIFSKSICMVKSDVL